jgi:hypothetical protein
LELRTPDPVSERGITEPWNSAAKNSESREKVVRIASLDGEGHQFLEDPEAALRALRNSQTGVDLFTFIQRLSETSPRHSYPTEWDSLAVLPVSMQAKSSFPTVEVEFSR